MSPAPSLSIVIAAWPDLRGLDTCLAAIDAEREPTSEVLVVALQPETTPRPGITWIEAAADRLIPHLWGAGIARARGEIVALTTAHFVPDRGWVTAIRAAHQRLAAPAIGGAIDPPGSGSAVDWATWFLRYGAYLDVVTEQPLPDVAGDNASYKRATLLRFPGWADDGFWERELHQRLRAAGEAVMFVPGIRVRLQTSFGFVGFLRQRFRHGRQFGGDRLRGRSALVRVLAAAAAPLVPPLLIARLVARVGRSAAYAGPFARALPALCCFATAWAAGEATGYLLGPAPAHR